ncbi:hypothetical protein FRB94_004200 [Tulasnella sp. JGI-2019a]|nr:hypothetical protein FRB93_010860 [Tulasnella sp. JGI-2019a]KAG9001995.1 hypothetical protein FRB94_004200 [Tulasnella sp. JGI-2019a]KAG9030287.1 hypothetical protein FRB95_004173 [Tulasnella sp. JGI-2019a]
MPPKQTPYQLSKGLGYNQKTPAFLVALQQRIAGNDPDNVDSEAIDGRPAIPTRPEGEASGDEESEDEKPQVVVIREGKHLTEVEADNESRKVKGLPPRQTINEHADTSTQPPASKVKVKDPKTGLSFSSSSSTVGTVQKAVSRKRKGVSVEQDPASDPTPEHQGEKKAKKAKRQAQSKALISFGDE